MKLLRLINKMLAKFGLIVITTERYEELRAWASYGQEGPDRFFGKSL